MLMDLKVFRRSQSRVHLRSSKHTNFPANALIVTESFWSVDGTLNDSGLDENLNNCQISGLELIKSENIKISADVDGVLNPAMSLVEYSVDGETYVESYESFRKKI